MDLRTLRYFIAVVEAGSLTAAAETLRISQPSLSVAITKLERDLGVQLLMRSTRGVEPTSAGKYLLDASARVLGEVDEITRTLGQFGAGATGQITLAAVPVLMWHRVPQLLRAHAAQVPNVTVQVVDPPPWGALDLLQQGRVDLAAIVVADPKRFAQRHRGQFDIIDWGEVPLKGVRPLEVPGSAVESVGDAYGNVPSETLSLSFLEGHTLLLPRRTPAVASLPEAVELALQEHSVVPKAVRTVETIQNIVPLIEAGLGVAVLPDPDGQSLARFRVRVCELDPPLPPMRALVLVRRGASSDAVLSRLLETLRT